ncbi:uncharacterized protein BJX67DRAFT_56831 [Aspergillus lucknowensis]|uniref:Uncharacterized protein n=1 Tax=Aspergillus lucknowensis TaxID=176173 RepID=A0ABR4LVH3_9EURO
MAMLSSNQLTFTNAFLVQFHEDAILSHVYGVLHENELSYHLTRKSISNCAHRFGMLKHRGAVRSAPIVNSGCQCPTNILLLGDLGIHCLVTRWPPYLHGLSVLTTCGLARVILKFSFRLIFFAFTGAVNPILISIRYAFSILQSPLCEDVS